MHGSSFQQFQQTALQLGHTDKILPRDSEGWKHFQRMYWRGLMKKITLRSRPLIDLNDVLKTPSGKNQADAGTAIIPLQQIKGTEGRVADFDADFHPLQQHSAERWVSVYNAIENGVVMPPVEVIQIGDVYFVRDGHHRISVAKAMGQTHIDAKVMVIKL